MKIHIIGGGIVGLCSAWYLTKAGYKVAVIDADNLQEGASNNNVGIVVPSHFVPMAAPGVIAKGIKWMFNSKSPFYIKPRFDFNLIEWLFRFYKSCSADNVNKYVHLLFELNNRSKQMYREFSITEGFDFKYSEKGLMMLFKTAEAEHEERTMLDKAEKIGISARMLSSDDVKKMNNGLDFSIKGAAYYESDAHLHPNSFISCLVSNLKLLGVEFISGVNVTEIERNRNKITKLILNNGESISTEYVIVAAGSWSRYLLDKAGSKILLQDGKGYSFSYNHLNTTLPVCPLILTEARVALTPMGNSLRVGGTMEINNFNTHINSNRVEGIIGSVKQYIPGYDLKYPSLNEIKYGFRPCTPDGVPYIGTIKNTNNLIVATGHAMMGMSLGPVTGKLVASLVKGEKTDYDMNLLSPERFN